MSNTETKIPDLSIMANIDRAELVSIVKMLGFDPDNVSSIYMASNEIIVHEREGIRSIGVVETFDIPEEHNEDVCSAGVTLCHECLAAGSA